MKACLYRSFSVGDWSLEMINLHGKSLSFCPTRIFFPASAEEQAEACAEPPCLAARDDEVKTDG